MGITEISRCELLTSPSGEEPHFCLLGKLIFHVPPKQRGLNEEESRERRETAVVTGWVAWITWICRRSTVECRMQKGRGGERVV